MPIGDGRKTYSDSTLMNMNKKELIDIIRCLENNCKSYQETIDIQAQNCMKLLEKSKIKTN